MKRGLWSRSVARTSGRVAGFRCTRTFVLGRGGVITTPLRLLAIALCRAGGAGRLLLLAVGCVIGTLFLLSSPLDAQTSTDPTPTPTPDPTLVTACSNGTVVPDTTQTGLISDCAWLLQMKADLIGTGAGAGTLNWSASIAITAWDGIQVTDSRVSSVELDSRSLTGVVPPALGNLTQLQHLSLWDNQLSGPIPAALGNLMLLESMYLDRNELSGPIPVGLADPGDLAALRILYLYDNELSGEIPEELGNLAQLQTLSLSRNELSGSIPAALGSLANLQHLSLWDNQLSGPIPAAVGNLAQLGLSCNRLTGRVPMELGAITTLTEAYL